MTLFGKSKPDATPPEALALVSKGLYYSRHPGRARDEAVATGLKGRVAEMEDRLARLQVRAYKRHQIAKEATVQLDLKMLTAPDFTASIRPGTPALMVIDEEAVPSTFWEPSEPRLNRQELVAELKKGAEITGVALSNPEPVISVRTR